MSCNPENIQRKLVAISEFSYEIKHGFDDVRQSRFVVTNNFSPSHKCTVELEEDCMVKTVVISPVQFPCTSGTWVGHVGI